MAEMHLVIFPVLLYTLMPKELTKYHVPFFFILRGWSEGVILRQDLKNQVYHHLKYFFMKINSNAYSVTIIKTASDLIRNITTFFFDQFVCVPHNSFVDSIWETCLTCFFLRPFLWLFCFHTVLLIYFFNYKQKKN